VLYSIAIINNEASTYLTLSLCQLVVALKVIAPLAVVLDSNTADTCPEVQIQEAVIESLHNDAVARLSKLKKELPQCGDGFWYQLVSINMSTSDSQCPDGWVEENEGEVRACGRGTVAASCQSAFLNSNHEIEFTKVCGEILMHFVLVRNGQLIKFMLME
jgi:hypothetical protein